MKWQTHHATGHRQIDEQHKTLLAASEQFREALEEGKGSRTYDLFLEFLAAYGEAHFSVEESCMLAHGCPAVMQSEHEHGLFRTPIEKEKLRFAKQGFDAASALAMLNIIDTWLDSHICQIDVRLRKALRQA
jgi:hemerythrin-like metal-binding protein